MHESLLKGKAFSSRFWGWGRNRSLTPLLPGKAPKRGCDTPGPGPGHTRGTGTGGSAQGGPPGVRVAAPFPSHIPRLWPPATLQQAQRFRGHIATSYACRDMRNGFGA